MKDFLLSEIQKDEWMMEILKSVRDLDLPDCWIGAGFVRNKAWDLLHHYNKRTPFADIDVVFFDKENSTEKFEQSLESKLKEKYPQLKWEVINQARTHLWHQKAPYHSTEEAISDWVETATCVGVQLGFNNELKLIAPHGLDDLEQLILRPVPSLKNMSLFNERIEKKSWLRKWPKLSVLRS